MSITNQQQPSLEQLQQKASLHMKTNDYSRAQIIYQEILRLSPNHISTLETLGILAGLQSNYDASCRYFSQCLELAPTTLAFYYNLAISQNKAGFLNMALTTLQRALDICSPLPNSPVEMAATYLKIGHFFRENEEYSAACRAFEYSCHYDATNHNTYLALGTVWMSLQQPTKAVVAFNHSLTLNATPETFGNRAQALLLGGYLEQGFAEYEWRTKIPEFAPIFTWFNQKPRWHGENFSGKTLLIHHEQGFGDTFQFFRYISLVKARGGTVIFSAKAPALRLLSDIDGIDTVVEHTEQALTNTHFDLCIPLMSLPYLFGTTLNTIPNETPYLSVSHDLQQQWKQRLIPTVNKLKVGIVWAGNPNHTHGMNRTCGLKALHPLLSIPNIDFYSLQKDPLAQELAALPTSSSLLDLTSDLQDFADTAALITHLDLVISVDTAVAHLAAALGKPTWTLLPFAVEWRWLVNTTVTPWYPTMSLFRQHQPKDWTGPVKQIQQQLLQLLQTRSL